MVNKIKINQVLFRSFWRDWDKNNETEIERILSIAKKEVMIV